MNNPTDVSLLKAAGLLLPPILTTEDIAKALGLRSISSVIRLHRTTGLPLAKIGRRYLVSRQAFQRWLEERAAMQPTSPERRLRILQVREEGSDQ